LAYGYRKVWKQGLEVAIKIKGSQGKRRVEWVKPEHPFTAISPASEVHANHNEAHNSALRRRCSAYRRRQNLYAKDVVGLQRSLTVQQLVHNWVRPHWGLSQKITPAMALGLYNRPVKMEEYAYLERVSLYRVLADQYRLHRSPQRYFHRRPIDLFIF
jgi:hypothetical protein